MNNIENSPDELFDWINRMGYSALNAEQKEIVDHFFSPEEYEAMHVAAATMRQNPLQEKDRKSRIRQELLNRFDEKHKQKSKTIALFPSVWNVAAALLIIGLPLSAYWLIRQNSQTLNNRLSDKIDTVYIEQAVEKQVKVYDTVYIEKEEKHKEMKRYDNVHRETYYREEKNEETIGGQLTGGSGLNIQSIEKLDALPNKPKRNAIKDDSLLNHYGFVTL
jgi:hypothetical protein